MPWKEGRAGHTDHRPDGTATTVVVTQDRTGDFCITDVQSGIPWDGHHPFPEQDQWG